MTKTKTEEKSYEQVYVKVDDLKNVTDVETASTSWASPTPTR